MMKLLSKLQASKNFWFLLTTSVLFFLLRLPSLFEPYWYGDEGIYEVIGYALQHGRLLYTGIWDNKPPLLYVMYAFFAGDQQMARLLSLLFGLFAVWMMFFLSKKLFDKNLPRYISTGIFAFLFAIPVIEGNIANAENFMLFWGISAALIVFSLATEKNYPTKLSRKNILLLSIAGVFVGISFLFKVVGVFDMAAFAVFLFCLSLPNMRSIFSAIKRVIPFVVGFLLPIIFCVLFFIAHHAFGQFIHSTFFSNVSYVNYGNQFIIPQGFLLLKTFLLGIATLFIFIKRKQFSPTVIFISLWTIFSIYNALFSQRPYTHYVLVLLPAFSFLVGLCFTIGKKRFLAIGISIVLLIFIYNSFTFYKHPLSYYENFLGFLFGAKSESSYQAFFDRIVPRDYALAAYINRHRKSGQTLFIWGNSGQLYKLTNTLPEGRFIVAYHVTMQPTNFAETKKVLEANPPTFIIVLPNQSEIPISLFQYKERVIIDNATIYERNI